ncbi:MAG: lysozyme [Ruminococcaceae bacterium]|nr:lysozyme [Oscillospiraceae bacterium]
MALFGNGRRHAQSDSKSGFNFTSILYLLSGMLVVACVLIVVFTSINNNSVKNSNDEPTEFVEQKTKYIKKGEIISINDPAMGTIEIEAVEGFAKNTYDNDSFFIDENGMMTYYIDDEVASCMGVDLSEFQGEVDFEKVKEQGFTFVILRIGGRYYSQEGGMYVDTNLHNYYKGARDAGLKVGGYFFSQATNEEEGLEEAEYALNQIRGMKFDYPIAFDWEIIEGDTARTDGVTGESLTDAAIAFCDTIEENGFKSIIYSNTNLMYYKYDLERLKDYEFWIADYENHPSMYYNFTMWQYNIEGEVDGISGPVDMNICMKNY